MSLELVVGIVALLFAILSFMVGGDSSKKMRYPLGGVFFLLALVFLFAAGTAPPPSGSAPPPTNTSDGVVAVPPTPTPYPTYTPLPTYTPPPLSGVAPSPSTPSAIIPIAPTVILPSNTSGCDGYDWETCWIYNDSARTMTWVGRQEGPGDIGQREAALTAVRSGYTVIFATKVETEINICLGTVNSQVINGCGTRVLPPGSYQVSSSTGGNGGFRVYPTLLITPTPGGENYGSSAPCDGYDREACWVYDNSARTMTWVGQQEGPGDIGQAGSALTAVRSGYGVIFTLTAEMEIDICVGQVDGQEVGTCKQLRLVPGIHRVDLSVGGNGGFLVYPP